MALASHIADGQTDAYSGSFLPAPAANAPTTAAAGGALAAATYFYKVTALNAAGESLASNEGSVTSTGATSANTITWGAVAGATGYRVYRGTAAGGENVYYAPGNVTTFTDTGAANTAGTPPATNTAFVPSDVVLADNAHATFSLRIPANATPAQVRACRAFIQAKDGNGNYTTIATLSPVDGGITTVTVSGPLTCRVFRPQNGVGVAYGVDTH